MLQQERIIIWQPLKTEIALVSERSDIIITGDINARTGKSPTLQCT